MAKYHRMSWNDRMSIERLYNSGSTYRQIARALGFAPSSIHREIHRGLYDHLGAETTKRPRRYSAQLGQDYADQQATAKGPSIKLSKRYDYAAHVALCVQQGLSPDLIVGTLRKQGKWTVSTVTLYRYIDHGYIPGVTNKNLWLKSRRKKNIYKKVQKAARPPKGLSIERRPYLPRHEPGHWEMDTVIGNSKGKRQAFLVMTERSTRYEIIVKLPDKSSRSVVHALDKIFPQFKPGTFKSITVDNGSEFQDCYAMEHTRTNKKRTTLYYCHPYSSFERGSNENANKLIRRFFPKGQSLYHVTQRECQTVQDWINNRPRKVLNYDTPAALFQQFQDTL